MRKADEPFAHYRIEVLLGHGGMGEVYRAFDTKLHRRVALKLLLTGTAEGDEARREAVARIIREARAAAALDHPNKVSVFELGEVEGTPYIAMEYIAGSTLRAFVGDPSIDGSRKIGWLLDVARALDAAHAAGLVHRDVKPENVMVREDGIVKVLDFGIARRAAGAADASAPTAAPAIEALTGAGVVIGTAAYMPPEQVQGRELDGRTDQFAWGVTAFELLAGRHPWGSGGDALALLGAMLTQPARRLEGFPDVVADTVARTLRADREERFARMADVVAALAPFAQPSGPMPSLPAAQARAPAVTGDESAETEVAPIGALTPAAVATAAPRRGVRRATTAAAVAVVATVAAIAAYRFATAGPRVEYCAAHVLSSTGPRCVGPVAPTSSVPPSHTYRLTYGRAGVDLVERTVGIWRWHPQDEPVRIEVRRAPDGAVHEVVGRDPFGEEIWHEVWSDGGARVDYVEPDGKSPRHFQERVTGARRAFDARGFLAQETYVGLSGKPRRDESEAFGRAWARGPDGFPLRETRLGGDGKPVADGGGVATNAYTEDGRGVPIEQRRLDLEGKLTTVFGVASQRFTYTADLELAGLAFFDAAGAPVASREHGSHAMRFVHDVAARTVRATWLDAQGKPRASKGDAYATTESLLDENGRFVERRFLGVDGAPVMTLGEGVAGWRFVREPHGRVSEGTALDAAGKPTTCRWGYARKVSVYSPRGFFLESRQYDVDGKAAPGTHFTAVAHLEYDALGLDVRMWFTDGDGKRAYHVAEGVGARRSKYDRMRNEVELVDLDADDKPMLHPDGFSSVRRVYDADDEVAEKTTFDAQGAPTYVDGYAKRRSKYDGYGFVAEESYFDTNEEPAPAKDGYAIVRFTRDRSGDVVEERYFGKDGAPAACKGAYAKKKNAYDVRRRRVETALFDAAGAPALGADGWAIERISYDDQGLVVREGHLDAAGQPVVTKAGSAANTEKYDAHGNVVEVTTLGEDLAPVVTADGYATKRSAYDERDLLVEESLFGADGAPIAGKDGWSVRKLRYDELGNLLDESFFDPERRPVVAKEPPYARRRDTFDARRRIVASSTFDASGVPMKGSDGAETVKYVRDASGNAIEIAYLDGAGAPTPSKEGKIVVRAKYDTTGKRLEEAYLDAAGKPRAAADGCAGHRTKYDALKRVVEEACVDESGALGASKDGWAAKRTLRDARGRVVDEATYGVDGARCADDKGVARRKHRYDERGDEVEVVAYDDKDNVVPRMATAAKK